MGRTYKRDDIGRFASTGSMSTQELTKIKNPHVPLNEDHVQNLQSQLQAGRSVEPLVIEASPKGDFLTDGHHRLEAARRAGVYRLPVIRFDATPEGRSAANKHMAAMEIRKLRR